MSIQTHSPEFVPGSTDGNKGWISYLYLNGACLYPHSPGSKTALGPSCLPPAFGKRYAISSRPNMTLGYNDPQIICYQRFNTTGHWSEQCCFDAEADWYVPNSKSG
jgi:hypothetical protein